MVWFLAQIALVIHRMQIEHCSNILTSSDSCTYNNVTHCSIESGHAICSGSHLPSVVDSIPQCVTSFHFYVDHSNNTSGKHYIYLSRTNFEFLANITEIKIAPKHRFDYYATYAECILNTTLGSLRNLQILSLNIMMKRCRQLTAKDGMLGTLQKLEILDFTRSTNLGLSYFFGFDIYPVKHLYLKNCQHFNTRVNSTYVTTLNITELLCPIGNTLVTADLSFNAITTLSINQKDSFCMTSLRFIDLQYNLIMWTGLADTDLPSLMAVAFFFTNRIYTFWTSMVSFR